VALHALALFEIDVKVQTTVRFIKCNPSLPQVTTEMIHQIMVIMCMPFCVDKTIRFDGSFKEIICCGV
jgi:hypothetical protein